MRNRSSTYGGYNYGYGYSYGPDEIQTKVAQLRREASAGRLAGFHSDETIAALGPLRRQLVTQVQDRRLAYLAEQSLAHASPRGLRSDSARILFSETPGQFNEDLKQVLGFNKGYRFAHPQEVAVCARRGIRREVLLAKGKGGAKHRRPRRNQWSNVKC